MPFQTTDPLMERARLVAAHLDGQFSVTELATRFAVSRPTVYKWIDRYRDGGAEALRDHSRARLTQHAKTDAEAERLLVEARRAHPTWGARKLLPYLTARHDGVLWPAVSTAAAILARHGLTKPRRKRRPPKHPGSTPLVAEAPNAVWTVDYKGQFRMGDGALCYPLTVCDAHSRFILGCHGLPSVEQYAALTQFERLFREYGLPDAIRSDNGTPFATQALCGLSRLSVWWIKLDIDHDRIDPGQPQQNGAHERMHRTLKAECARPPKHDMASQQVRFDAWRSEFNDDRPHEALALAVPGSVYTPSLRAMPDVLPEAEYPGHYEVRYLSSCGTVRFKTKQFFVSQTLSREHIGFEEVADGIWDLYFFDRLLARLDERTWRLTG
jgi:transposase InsO family protein